MWNLCSIGPVFGFWCKYVTAWFYGLALRLNDCCSHLEVIHASFIYEQNLRSPAMFFLRSNEIILIKFPDKIPSHFRYLNNVDSWKFYHCGIFLVWLCSLSTSTYRYLLSISLDLFFLLFFMPFQSSRFGIQRDRKDFRVSALLSTVELIAAFLCMMSMWRNHSTIWTTGGKNSWSRWSTFSNLQLKFLGPLYPFPVSRTPSRHPFPGQPVRSWELSFCGIGQQGRCGRGKQPSGMTLTVLS